VGGGWVLAEAAIGKRESPVDVGVVRLVICRRPLGTDGAGGKSRSMVRSEKEAFRKEVLEAIRVLEEVKFQV